MYAEKRDRGITYEYLQRRAENLRVAFNDGVSLDTSVYFPIGDIIGELNTVSSKLGLGIQVDPTEPALRRTLADGIAHALTGTRFELTEALGDIRTLTDQQERRYHGTQVTLQSGVEGRWKDTIGIPFAGPVLLNPADDI